MPPHDSLSSHIILTSHPSQQIVHSTPINWGAKTASERGPIIATLTTPSMRNAIGTHGGIYSVYRALAATAGRLPGEFVPDLTNTAPAERIGPYPDWANRLPGSWRTRWRSSNCVSSVAQRDTGRPLCAATAVPPGLSPPQRPPWPTLNASTDAAPKVPRMTTTLTAR